MHTMLSMVTRVKPEYDDDGTFAACHNDETFPYHQCSGDDHSEVKDLVDRLCTDQHRQIQWRSSYLPFVHTPK